MGDAQVGKKRRQGKAFEHEWWLGMEEFKRREGGRVRIHRHYDLSDYVGRYCPNCKRSLDICGNCHQPLPSSKARPPRQPSDFEAVWQGIDILMECKSSRNPASFEMRYIKDHQMCAALNNISAGGQGVFILQDRSKPKDIKVYCIKADVLLGLSHRIGKNCLRWTDIDPLCFSHPTRLMLGEGPKRAPMYDFGQFMHDLLAVHKGVPSEFVQQWGVLVAETKKGNIMARPMGVTGVTGFIKDA